MPQEQPQYYRAVPVSENPKKSGYYLTPLGKIYYSSRKEAFMVRKPTHYLEPIPIPDAERLREALEKLIQFNEGMVIGLEAEYGLESEAIEIFRPQIKAAREALSAVGAGWIRVEDQKPELNKLVWFGWEEDKSVELGRIVPGEPYLEKEPVYESETPRLGRYVEPPTHWKPFIIPSPPLNK